MKRREFIISGVATVSLISGCLDQESDDSETESETIDSYPVGFNERSVSANTVVENHRETILTEDSSRTELLVSDDYTERTVGKKDETVRSIDIYTGEENQAILSKLSVDENTYTRDRSQSNMYSIENDKILSVESIGRLETLRMVLNSIIIRSEGLEDNQIVYNVVGASNNSQLNQIFTSEEGSYTGEVRVDSETGLVNKLTISSNTQKLSYTFTLESSISDWSDTAKENISPISATEKNNVLLINTQNDTIQQDSSLVIIPSNRDETYNFVFNQTVQQQSTLYLGLSGSTVTSATSIDNLDSTFSSGIYTILLLNPQGQEIKRFEVSV